LSTAVLSEADLSDADLSGADLSGLRLKGVSFRGANLQMANIEGAILVDVTLTDADVTGIRLTGITLSSTDLNGLNLSGQDLQGIDFSGISLQGSDLTQANLSGADFNGANLVSANLSGSDLSNTIMTDVDLTGANLSAADLSGADLTGTLLIDATGLTNEMLANAATWEGAWLDSLEDIQNAMARVCNGQGVPEAASYVPGPGIHPFVLLRSSGQPFGGSVPDDWQPHAIQTTELVACIGAQEENLIQTCYYNGPNIERFRKHLNVELRSAQTGAIIASQNIYGSLPRLCRAQEPYDLTRLAGGSVETWVIIEWIVNYPRPYVDNATPPELPDSTGVTATG
jgi:uncharacterized protein YjbI with pentapeptide repeats